MNYEESLAYINQLNSRGIALGLERMQALLKRLGDPQKQLRCIHVAGTNGKGSVCAFLDAALQQAGLQVAVISRRRCMNTESGSRSMAIILVSRHLPAF